MKIEDLSEDSVFSLAYGAAHALSLAALRWHGYRSDDRYQPAYCTRTLEKARILVQYAG